MKYLKFTIIILNIALMGLQLGLASRRATEGDKLSQLETQLQALTVENQDLSAKIYTYSSTVNILNAAKAANLTPMKVTTLSPLPVAAKYSP